MAQADVSEEFYAEWEQTYYKASTAVQEREKKKAEAAELIEINLQLIGATAIEDRLQEVGTVGATAIEDRLQEVGTVWVLLQ